MFDGHNDTLLKLLQDYRGDERCFFEGLKGHIDIHKAREGGLKGGFFAIFVPNQRNKRTTSLKELFISTRTRRARRALAIEHEYARSTAIEMIGIAHRMELHPTQSFVLARDIAQLNQSLEDDILTGILHFEGAQPIDPQLQLLPVYYEAGLRSLGIVWSRPNAFGHGVPFLYPHDPDTGPGLTDAGMALVKQCNQMGIMIDMAHLNFRGFWDVARLSEHPLVVTHACAHAICPSARNLTDSQLDAIAESNGVVGINFFVADVRPDGHIQPDTPLSMIVDHMKYIADRVGVAHVAFGSDFDGALMPSSLQSVAKLPLLVDAMREGGFNAQEIQAICQDNWVRVLTQTWQ